MIVICTKCQAKFRVADEKIGPRGAKVRCSRCHTVFHVAAGPPPLPQAHPESPPSGPPLGGTEVELESPFGGGAGPPAARAEVDPFIAAGFGAAPASPPAPAAPTPDGGDPFASQAADPFGAPPADGHAPQEGGSLAVTDISQLLGEAPPEPAGTGPAPPRPPAPDDGDLGGLALEDRITPPPLPAPRPPLEASGGASPVHAADPFALGGDPAVFGAYELGSPEGEPSLALASEASVPAALPSPPPPAAPAAPPAAAPPAARAPSRAAPEIVLAPVEGERSDARRGSRLRAALVNAIALAVLLAVTLAILVVWRGEGAFEASALRPSAVLAALGRGGAGASPFAAVEIRSGEYEREKGPPLVFVRGKVISRARAAVRGVKVLVEIVRAGGVVARGEGLAGAVPTPEELYEAGEGPAFAALEQAAAARAPREIRPGDAVPFLVAIAGPTIDLDGASVRVRLAPAEGMAP